MLDHPLCEETIPKIQSKLPLVQLETIYLHPIAHHQRKEIDTLTTAISSVGSQGVLQIGLIRLLKQNPQPWLNLYLVYIHMTIPKVL